MASTAAHPRRRRRRVVGRRRFRYRKQAWCILVSIVILGLGANLAMVIKLLVFTTTGNFEPTKNPKPSAGTKFVGMNGFGNSNDTTFLRLASELLELVIALTVLFKFLRTVLEPSFPSMSFHSWKVIVLAPIAVCFDSFRAALRWCRGGENHYRQQHNRRRVVDSNSIAMTVTETLEAFNRERSARGESTVSAESIQAYERFLQDLATSVIIADENSALALATTATISASRNSSRESISPAELEILCPRWTLNDTTGKDEEENIGHCHPPHHHHHHFVSQTECGICLDSLDCSNDNTIRTLRTLPCKHTFHSQCIDQWLERSVSCPICKQSVLSSSPSPPRPRSNVDSQRSTTSSRDNTIHIL